MRAFIGIYTLSFFTEIYVTLLYKKWNGHSETIPEITKISLQEEIDTFLFSLIKKKTFKKIVKMSLPWKYLECCPVPDCP